MGGGAFFMGHPVYHSNLSKHLNMPVVWLSPCHYLPLFFPLLQKNEEEIPKISQQKDYGQIFPQRKVDKAKNY